MLVTLTPNQIADANYRQLTLSNVKSQRVFTTEWSNWEYELTHEEINQIVTALGGTSKTKSIIAYKLAHLNNIPNNGYFDRIIFDVNSRKWEYCAGAAIRKYIKSL